MCKSGSFFSPKYSDEDVVESVMHVIQKVEENKKELANMSVGRVDLLSKEFEKIEPKKRHFLVGEWEKRHQVKLETDGNTATFVKAAPRLK